ncbi:MAG: protoheme IX farnesyltransferase [Chloroflexi bacterium]|nr:protoheme IX farnesyltransferase [Chloroflexota bacterium]
MSVSSYFEVLKPRESLLLTFLGISGAVIAGGGISDPERLLVTTLAVALGCEGVNGLTNYLDREVDGVMRRTCTRSLPARRIYPPQKVLPLTLGLIGAGLVIAWFLNPVCFVAGVVGTAAAVVWRKTAWTHLLGSISGVAPLAIGWLAMSPRFDWTLLLLSLLVAFWVPLHVWSVMVANRQDYLRAGVRIFPVTWETKDVVKIFLALSGVLFVLSVWIYTIGALSWVYLFVAVAMGISMVLANWKLMVSVDSRDAWKVYKLSAFPYLGIIFSVLVLETLLR